MDKEKAVTDLIERLRGAAADAAAEEYGVSGLLAEAAEALEAARADAERIKRDIFELCDVMPMLPITAETMDAATDWFKRYCIDFHREIYAAREARNG